MFLQCDVDPYLNSSGLWRSAEVDTLLGDATRAREILGWSPTTSFDELVREMVQEDLKTAQRDQLVRKHGFQVHDHHE